MNSISLSCKQSHCPWKAGCLPFVTSLLGSILLADGPSVKSVYAKLRTSDFSDTRLPNLRTLWFSGKGGTQWNTNDKDISYMLTLHLHFHKSVFHLKILKYFCLYISKHYIMSHFPCTVQTYKCNYMFLRYDQLKINIYHNWKTYKHLLNILPFFCYVSTLLFILMCILCLKSFLLILCKIKNI